MPATIENDKCVSCEICMDVCPAEAIIYNDKEEIAIDPNFCMDCGACVDECANEAIEME